MSRSCSRTFEFGAASPPAARARPPRCPSPSTVASGTMLPCGVLDHRQRVAELADGRLHACDRICHGCQPWRRDRPPAAALRSASGTRRARRMHAGARCRSDVCVACPAPSPAPAGAPWPRRQPLPRRSTRCRARHPPRLRAPVASVGRASSSVGDCVVAECRLPGAHRRIVAAAGCRHALTAATCPPHTACATSVQQHIAAIGDQADALEQQQRHVGEDDDRQQPRMDFTRRSRRCRGRIASCCSADCTGPAARSRGLARAGAAAGSRRSGPACAAAVILAILSMSCCAGIDVVGELDRRTSRPPAAVR